MPIKKTGTENGGFGSDMNNFEVMPFKKSS